MKELVVRYSRGLVPFVEGRWQMRVVTVQAIDDLKRRIEDGFIDELILVGPNVATGWRVGVTRPVTFVERPTFDEQDAIAQRQAAFRIVELCEGGSES